MELKQALLCCPQPGVGDTAWWLCETHMHDYPLLPAWADLMCFRVVVWTECWYWNEASHASSYSYGFPQWDVISWEIIDTGALRYWLSGNIFVWGCWIGSAGLAEMVVSPAVSHSEEEKWVNILLKIAFSCFSSWVSLWYHTEMIN